MKSVAEMSTKELKAMVAEREAAENQEREVKRELYEKDKDDLINALGSRAHGLSVMLKDFKSTAMTDVLGFRKTLLEYGALKGGDKNKGNFEIKNDQFRVSFSSQVKKCFDERSELAEEKLKLFLSTTVKKRDQKLHKLILSLLERNKVGDLDISNIQRLYQMENDFEDTNWKEAIALFKESYKADGTTFYVRFFLKNETNGWDLINLNFSSL
jgi:hypothetical protein